MNKGYAIATIHGGMDVEARKQAQRDFRVRAKIMIATDAAGEGINLQFCRYLINWDVPWNPNRLEQRMGRIHRYGQADEVHVFNLVAINTREGAVLQTVLHKMDVMRDQMGTDRVYDVIDELLEDVPLVRLMEQSIDSADNREAVQEAERRTNGLDAKADSLVALQKKQSLASRLDLRAAKELRDLSDERRLQPLFIQRFFTAAYLAAGGTVNEDKHYPVFHIGRVPSALLDVARQVRLPVADKYDNPFVFDKNLVSVASRVAVPEYTKLHGPGHPLFDTLIEWAIRRARETFARGAVLIDPNIVQPQRLWLLRSVVDDGRHEQKVRKAHEQLNVIIADSLGLRSTSPAYLLTCTTPAEKPEMPALPERTAEDIQAWAWENVTEEQVRKVTDHRQAECDLRRQYLNTTFTDLILDLQNKLNELHQEQLLGEDDEEERQKLEHRLQQLRQRKATRMAELDLMLRLTANLPEIKLRQLADRAFLYVVTFCKGGKPRLRIIQDPIAKLTPEMLYRQVQFLVEEQDWSLNGEEVEVPS